MPVSPDKSVAPAVRSAQDVAMTSDGEFVWRPIKPADAGNWSAWGGVHPAYRQRGLGGRLLSWAETAAVPLHRERYPDRPLSLFGSLTVDADSPTGAVGLYERAGFTVDHTSVTQSKPLLP